MLIELSVLPRNILVYHLLISGNLWAIFKIFLFFGEAFVFWGKDTIVIDDIGFSYYCSQSRTLSPSNPPMPFCRQIFSMPWKVIEASMQRCFNSLGLGFCFVLCFFFLNIPQGKDSVVKTDEEWDQHRSPTIIHVDLGWEGGKLITVVLNFFKGLRSYSVQTV